jgi:hypothetical protein
MRVGVDAHRAQFGEFPLALGDLVALGFDPVLFLFHAAPWLSSSTAHPERQPFILSGGS